MVNYHYVVCDQYNPFGYIVVVDSSQIWVFATRVTRFTLYSPLVLVLRLLKRSSIYDVIALRNHVINIFIGIPRLHDLQVYIRVIADTSTSATCQKCPP